MLSMPSYKPLFSSELNRKFHHPQCWNCSRSRSLAFDNGLLLFFFQPSGRHSLTRTSSLPPPLPWIPRIGYWRPLTRACLISTYLLQPSTRLLHSLSPIPFTQMVSIMQGSPLTRTCPKSPYLSLPLARPPWTRHTKWGNQTCSMPLFAVGWVTMPSIESCL